MKVNYRRGLFRLWIIASGVWLAAMAITHGETIGLYAGPHAMAAEAGLADGFRALRWGMEPLRGMVKIERRANMDVYFMHDDEKHVAGVNAFLVLYMFYGGGLCRVEVKWGNLSDEQHLRIRSTLVEHWGKPRAVTENSRSFYSEWLSSSGTTTAFLSSIEPLSTPEKDWLVTLVIQQVACSKSAIEGRGV